MENFTVKSDDNFDAPGAIRFILQMNSEVFGAVPNDKAIRLWLLAGLPMTCNLPARILFDVVNGDYDIAYNETNGTVQFTLPKEA